MKVLDKVREFIAGPINGKKLFAGFALGAAAISIYNTQNSSAPEARVETPHEAYCAYIIPAHAESTATLTTRPNINIFGIQIDFPPVVTASHNEGQNEVRIPTACR